MVYSYEIEGIPVQTGDILCTTNGGPDILTGEFWRFIGRLVPGEVDHVAVYVGPGGRCVEAGARGVISFDVPTGQWNTERMALQRGLLFDTFYGVAAPLDGLQVSAGKEFEMRSNIAAYCLAQVGKAYNLNFLRPDTEEAFYCSQLAYKAYQQIGIDLNTGLAMEQLPGTNTIVYPQEIWNAFGRRRAKRKQYAAENRTPPVNPSP